jgi:hypothetical protein
MKAKQYAAAFCDAMDQARTPRDPHAVKEALGRAFTGMMDEMRAGTEVTSDSRVYSLIYETNEKWNSFASRIQKAGYPYANRDAIMRYWEGIIPELKDARPVAGVIR